MKLDALAFFLALLIGFFYLYVMAAKPLVIIKNANHCYEPADKQISCDKMQSVIE